MYGSVAGPAKDEEKEVKFLGRRIRINERGLQWEGDSKPEGELDPNCCRWRGVYPEGEGASILFARNLI